MIIDLDRVITHKIKSQQGFRAFEQSKPFYRVQSYFSLASTASWISDELFCLSKTSQIIFDLHPGFSHMEDEKGSKLHLFKKYF